MNKSWLGLGLIAMAMFLVIGCGGAETAPPAEEPDVMEEEVMEEEVMEEEMMEEEIVMEEVPEEMVGPEDLSPEEWDVDPFFDDLPAVMEEEEVMEEEVYVTEEVEMPGEEMPVAMGSPEFETVYFDFDRSEIKPEFDYVISQNAATLMADTSLYVIIEGHCDERGTTEYNLALGNRRANSVRDALISEGVDSSQLDTVSYGEEQPVAFGHDEDSWSLNRRSVITIR